jgi:hypothetical protein
MNKELYDWAVKYFTPIKIPTHWNIQPVYPSMDNYVSAKSLWANPAPQVKEVES